MSRFTTVSDVLESPESAEMARARADREAKKRLDLRLREARRASEAASGGRLSAAGRAILESSLPREDRAADVVNGKCSQCQTRVSVFAETCIGCGSVLAHHLPAGKMRVVESLRDLSFSNASDVPPRPMEFSGRVLEAEFRAAPNGDGAWKQYARLRGLSPETIRAMEGGRGRAA